MQFTFLVAVSCQLVPAARSAAMPPPCEPWDDHFKLIKNDFRRRLEFPRRLPAYELAIVTSARPRGRSLSYFGVVLGSLVGQGGHRGTIHVTYNGDRAASE
jgi:hypothetical protein